MSTRIFIRIIVPSTYRVVRSVEHATQNYMRNHVNNSKYIFIFAELLNFEIIDRYSY